MPLDPRYTTIVAMLDDPLNRVCVERELARRVGPTWPKGFIPPPIRKSDGGLSFVTMREFQRHPALTAKKEEVTPLLDLFQGSEGWFIVQNDLSEIGPFDSLAAAKHQAEAMLRKQGYRLLSEAPWGEAEVRAYPLRSRTTRR